MNFRRKLKLWLEGASTLLCIFPPERPYRFKIDTRTDEEKMRGDWEAAGRDLQKAMDERRAKFRSKFQYDDKEKPREYLDH